ncbi:transposase [Kovacikia minuta CCNUW1]|uniref:REP-associated tyrosine transposase n=1 Tax=Kovacikia minuta TaxID=2931930 RepID=UPI001CCA0937|nr:transposase [Kovacikia minuta]UBF27204.1 transposase [Kovacikia minuta CCNUW1]
MPYRAIAFEPGNFYHLYNRGNNRQNICFERENYLHFLRLVRRHLTVESVEILAYCLMPNHYHLLVYLKAGNLSEPMKSLSLAYTKGMNARYERVGALFQGRFCSIQVEQEAYLLHLVRYIHLNPVKGGLVKHPGEWEFSSYREYAGLRQGTLPKLERVQALTGAKDAYQMFLEDHSLPQEPKVRSLMLDE